MTGKHLHQFMQGRSFLPTIGYMPDQQFLVRLPVQSDHPRPNPVFSYRGVDTAGQNKPVAADEFDNPHVGQSFDSSSQSVRQTLFVKQRVDDQESIGDDGENGG